MGMYVMRISGALGGLARNYAGAAASGSISGDPGICDWGRAVGEAGWVEAGWVCLRIRINSLKIVTPRPIFVSRSSLDDANDSIFSIVV